MARPISGKRVPSGHGYVVVYEPTHPHANRSGYVLEHVLIAERALRKPLPKGTEVHHLNSDPSDNRPSNLVICQDHAYHLLLHRRQRAFAETGHADFVRCRYCGHHDDPAQMYTRRNASGEITHSWHRRCATNYVRKWRAS